MPRRPEQREAVLRWAPPAGEQAARSGSHREAGARISRALRFADGLAAAERAELLQRRADECFMTDQFDAAIEGEPRRSNVVNGSATSSARETRCVPSPG